MPVTGVRVRWAPPAQKPTGMLLPLYTNAARTAVLVEVEVAVTGNTVASWKLASPALFCG